MKKSIFPPSMMFVLLITCKSEINKGMDIASISTELNMEGGMISGITTPDRGVVNLKRLAN